AFPSALAPCSAKNSARGCTFRESQATCRISKSPEVTGTLVSVPSSTAVSFIVRFKTGPRVPFPTGSSPGSAGDLRSCSFVWFKLRLILMSATLAGSHGFRRRCPELHGDFRASPHPRSWRRSLLGSKITANQNWLESQSQTHTGYFTHGLPVK